MTLYEINAAIAEAIDNAFTVDEETGEIKCNDNLLDELLNAREEKIENILLYIKNLDAEAKDKREEEKKLAERRRADENRIEWLKQYVSASLAGEKFSTARVEATFRKSTAVKIDESLMSLFAKDYPELMRHKEPEPDKTAIKAYLQEVGWLPFAELEEKTSLVIK